MRHDQDLTACLFANIKKLNLQENGIRIIANLHSHKTALLVEFRAFRQFLESETQQFKHLNKSAEFYHNFSNEGFAGIDCFQNSHVSVKTTPGINDILFDMYLSNELEGNDEISQHLYRKTIEFFESKVIKERVIVNQKER